MNTFRVTYTDGTHYETNANGTAEDLLAHLMLDGGHIVFENPVTGKETIKYIKKVEQIHPSEIKARALIASRTTYELVLDWEEIEKQPTSEAVFIIRGFLLDELEKRNKAAFDSWLDSNEVSPRKFFVA